MSRSERAERGERKYSSARTMAEKVGSGFSATYLKIPEGVKIYKPKVGTALLDVIPFEAAGDNPNADEGVLHWERTFWIHRGIGANSESFLCLAKNFKEKCPVCEHRLVLLEDGDEDSEKQRKELAPKQRQLINIYDRKDPDKGVQLMDQSFFAFGEVLLARILSGEESDHWDLFFTVEDGYTLRIVWEEETIGKGRAFTKAQSIDFKERKDPIDEDLLEEATQLDKLLIETPYKELKQTFLSGGKEKDKDEDEPPRRRREKEEDVKPRSRRDEDEDRTRTSTQPRSKREDDEPPRRKKDKDDDWENERSPSKRDADEDEPPKRKRDADEDEPPKRKRDADEDEPPKRKRDADEDEPPRSKKDKDEGSWDDFDEKPRRSKDKDEDEPPKRKRDQD